MVCILSRYTVFTQINDVKGAICNVQLIRLWEKLISLCTELAALLPRSQHHVLITNTGD